VRKKSPIKVYKMETFLTSPHQLIQNPLQPAPTDFLVSSRHFLEHFLNIERSFDFNDSRLHPNLVSRLKMNLK
jgi:hypothetical protein